MRFFMIMKCCGPQVSKQLIVIVVVDMIYKMIVVYAIFNDLQILYNFRWMEIFWAQLM